MQRLQLKAGDLISYKTRYENRETFEEVISVRTEVDGIVIYTRSDSDGEKMFNRGDLEYKLNARKVDVKYLLKRAEELSKKYCNLQEKFEKIVQAIRE